MRYIDDFFDAFLKSKMNIPLVEGMDSYSSLFSIEFTDTNRVFLLSIKNGMIEDIKQSLDSNYLNGVSVRFLVNEQSFYKIITKQISPQSAFFTRQTDIKGNMFEGMKLARLLSSFFEKHSYIMPEKQDNNL